MERTFWAPGRVNLIGEHTDYSGGLVLPAAMHLGVTLAGSRSDRIVLRSDRDGTVVDVAADGSEAPPAAGWGRYVSAVAHELHVLGRPAVGFTGSVSSTVPVGAGLSSSAALEVAIATALCAVAELELPPVELAAACQRAEMRAVGVPCGIMDQAASVLGRAGCAILLDCGTLAYETVPLPAGLALVVVDSGVRHRHEHGSYAERRSELERALVVLKGRRPSTVSLAEAEELARAADLDGLLWRRLRHVVTENERVRAVVEALRGPDPVGSGRLGPLFRAGHDSQRDDYDVSTPELDLLVDLAYDHGAGAARMTGGGFGGSVVALVAEDDAASFGALVGAAYRGSVGTEATVCVCSAASGARELT